MSTRDIPFRRPPRNWHIRQTPSFLEDLLHIVGECVGEVRRGPDIVPADGAEEDWDNYADLRAFPKRQPDRLEWAAAAVCVDRSLNRDSHFLVERTWRGDRFNRV